MSLLRAKTAVWSVLRIQDIVVFLFWPRISHYMLPFSLVYRTFPYPESRAEGSHPTLVYSRRCESDDTQPQSDTIPWARRLWHQTRHCNYHRHSAGQPLAQEHCFVSFWLQKVVMSWTLWLTHTTDLWDSCVHFLTLHVYLCKPLFSLHCAQFPMGKTKLFQMFKWPFGPQYIGAWFILHWSSYTSYISFQL